MIRYSLICENDHEFEGWFRNSQTFEAQADAGEIPCPMCSSVSVTRALMAPNVSSSKQVESSRRQQMAMAMGQMQQAMRELKQKVENNFENVGEKFPEEARKIYYGETEERGIYGTTTVDEAKELIEEGIDLIPLPEDEKLDS